MGTYITSLLMFNIPQKKFTWTPHRYASGIKVFFTSTKTFISPRNKFLAMPLGDSTTHTLLVFSLMISLTAIFLKCLYWRHICHSFDVNITCKLTYSQRGFLYLSKNYNSSSSLYTAKHLFFALISTAVTQYNNNKIYLTCVKIQKPRQIEIL